VLEAAFLLHLTMLQVRSVRYAPRVGQVPLREISNAFSGAGERILAAAAQPPSARDQAFRRLAEEWIGNSPQLARRIARRLPDGHWLGQVSQSGRQPLPEAAMPARAQLTLAGYTAEHLEYGRPRDATAVINLAVPDGSGGWTLQALEFQRPARVTLDTAAFIGPGTVLGSPGRSLTVGGDALAVHG
jgi:hypothetical protein